ncbi:MULTISPECIES: prepilin peptidase [unclassified Rathayibacter]|uniref:prepilin peptidase n=1 Tax=unclassified Rathayibacter TaxID=2609250 RepID=UPI00188A5B3A|nr:MULTISPECIES: prepilin peptidase [unclassified Rathayibacter]MBF4463427.1 prepilin peptidase [Rathayibacter sp. VKM Ac-2879]MBF4504850.1 prepilin peptidase [Rathayibacter sp. VKM Ac-2878]
MPPVSWPDRVAIGGGGAALAAVVVARPVPGPAAILALLVAVVTVPLVLADVRERRLPNALTGALLVGAVAEALGSFAAGRPPSGVVATVGTALALGVLHVAGGLGLGDVKLGAALACPLGLVDPLGAAFAPACAFVLAGCWAVPLLVRRDRGRVAFGPFQLAAFWIVLLL